MALAGDLLHHLPAQTFVLEVQQNSVTLAGETDAHLHAQAIILALAFSQVGAPFFTTGISKKGQPSTRGPGPQPPQATAALEAPSWMSRFSDF